MLTRDTPEAVERKRELRMERAQMIDVLEVRQTYLQQNDWWLAEPPVRIWFRFHQIYPVRLPCTKALLGAGEALFKLMAAAELRKRVRCQPVQEERDQANLELFA